MCDDIMDQSGDKDGLKKILKCYNNFSFTVLVNIGDKFIVAI